MSCACLLDPAVYRGNEEFSKQSKGNPKLYVELTASIRNRNFVNAHIFGPGDSPSRCKVVFEIVSYFKTNE